MVKMWLFAVGFMGKYLVIVQSSCCHPRKMACSWCESRLTSLATTHCVFATREKLSITESNTKTTSSQLTMRNSLRISHSLWRYRNFCFYFVITRWNVFMLRTFMVLITMLQNILVIKTVRVRKIEHFMLSFDNLSMNHSVKTIECGCSMGLCIWYCCGGNFCCCDWLRTTYHYHMISLVCYTMF